MIITENTAINRNYSTDDIEVLVMIEGSEYVHKTDIKVDDWPDYLWYGYNGKRTSEEREGKPSTVEFLNSQEWSWSITDKKHPTTYDTDY